MSEILSRAAIARMADQAAQHFVRTGRMEAPPFAPESDQWKQFFVDFQRYIELHTAPQDVERGA